MASNADRPQVRTRKLDGKKAGDGNGNGKNNRASGESSGQKRSKGEAETKEGLLARHACCCTVANKAELEAALRGALQRMQGLVCWWLITCIKVCTVTHN